MRRSANRRAAPDPRSRRRRFIAAAGALVVFGAIIGVTQISNADDNAAAQTKKTSPSGLEILANDCSESNLDAHDGFQLGNRCVSTEFGEVGAQEKNPTLLITDAPESVEAGKPFQLKISTRNLVRDRFLAAGQGGYYVESSVLTEEGLVRGHFHTACRMLSNTGEAPESAPVPAFFVATEDKKGGATPDTVTIQVPGMPDEGTAQCSSWAGDGSHRIPMMQRANQTPAIDSVRIEVRRGEEAPPAEEPPAEEPPAEQPPAEEPPAEEPPAQEPPAEQPPAQEEQPQQPPAQEEEEQEQPPAQEQPQTNSGTIKTTKPPATEKPAKKSDDSDEAQPRSTAKAVTSTEKTKKSEKTESTGKAAEPDPTATEDDLVITADGDDGAPDPDAPGSGIEPAAAQSEDTGKLAFTGTSTAAMIGGGTVVLLIGFVILSATRRRRPRSQYYQ